MASSPSPPKNSSLFCECKKTPVLREEAPQRVNYRRRYWGCAAIEGGCDFKVWVDIYNCKTQSVIEELWDEKEGLKKQVEDLSKSYEVVEKQKTSLVEYVRYLKNRMN